MAPADAPFQRIQVIGLGYVGLPTAAVFAGRGFGVTGVDIDAGVVGLINRGAIHIIEPDLDTAVRDAVAAGTLRATVTPEEADAHILALPTPLTEKREADLDLLFAAAESLIEVLKAGDLVIVESTVPVGTTRRLSRLLAEARPDLRFPHDVSGDAGDDADVHVAHSPERVLPGRIMQELVANDRVIGGVSAACGERAAALYRLAVEGECLVTTAPTAELVKLMENAYRDVNIAFANEISLVSEELGIDVWEAIELANRHPRVNVLQPGPGVGGHCIAVDPWFIVESAPDVTPLIRAARAVNDARPEQLAGRVLAAASEMEKPVIACLGLAYKADVDDLRESPAVAVAKRLAEAKAGEVLVVEPHVDALPDALTEAGAVLADLDAALRRATIVVLLTGHAEFRALAKDRLAGRTVFDARGVWR